MRIEGKKIAANIYKDLQDRVGELKKNGIVPRLTVILIGDNPASKAYVKQKQKWGECIGTKITVIKYPKSVTFAKLKQKILELNADQDNHAILIQRPLPKHLNAQKLELLINPQKDIDGFHPDSPYVLPLPLAVVKILEEIYFSRHPEAKPKDLKILRRAYTEQSRNAQNDSFQTWLRNQNIVIIGKGSTGGGPILKYFNKLNAYPIQIDSKTISPGKLIKKADIVISAVGKPNSITSEKIKKNVIIIGVGIYRDSDGKLKGDYDEDYIAKKASYYTPTPGGVGPVNVAMLMDNLITATEKQVLKKN